MTCGGVGGGSGAACGRNTGTADDTVVTNAVAGAAADSDSDDAGAAGAAALPDAEGAPAEAAAEPEAAGAAAAALGFAADTVRATDTDSSTTAPPSARDALPLDTRLAIALLDCIAVITVTC